MSNYKLIKANCFDVLDSMNKENTKVDLILTDPPYFILPKGKGKDKFEWDNFKTFEEFKLFTEKWYKKAFDVLNENGIMFVFWSQKWLKEGLNIFNPNRVVLWHYSNLVLGGNGDFAYDYEPIFVIHKGNPKLKKGKHSCILNYTKPQSNFKTDKKLHPAQKPLECVKHLISIANPKSVLDPFMGANTTGLACKELNIPTYIGIEKEEEYFKLAKDRIRE